VDAQWRLVERGAPWVGFRVSDGRESLEALAPVHDEREVVDSGGHRSRRVFLRTRLCVAGHVRAIELNLCDRRGMAFPMLLGRSAIAGAFAVDPGRSFVHGKSGSAPRAAGCAKATPAVAIFRMPVPGSQIPEFQVIAP
jgi:hypothetical protein